MADASEAPRAVVHLVLKVCDDTLNVRIKVPATPIRVVDLLPVLMSFDDAGLGAYEKEALRQGKAISCKKGCGACCRQLVPISEVEAQYLTELVAEMAPQRRDQVETRFRQAREELERKGMRDRLLRAFGQAAPDELRQLTADYFACRVPCPFLEEESCSIHLHRPLICRENCRDVHRSVAPLHAPHV